MDQSKSPKPSMSFPSIRYNANQEELEDLFLSENEKSINLDTSDHSPIRKKAEKSTPSILDKYFKAFKADKPPDKPPEETKTEETKSEEIVDKKSTDLSNSEISGSPIKEYFSKFNKRSDSTETHTEGDSVKDTKEKEVPDRWRLFTDIKDKLAQAVEDIKSSRTVEGDSKDKNRSCDNFSDSEDNSIQQDLEQNSCASTENQVSSLVSSTHNLSDLSPSLVSHSNTITDSEMETTSSSDNNHNVTPTEEGIDDATKTKPPDLGLFEDVAIVDHNTDEIESGIDVLEDFELQNKAATSDDIGENKDVTEKKSTATVDNSNNKLEVCSGAKLKLIVPQMEPFFSSGMMFLTMVVFFSMVAFPSFVMLNGFFIGTWFSLAIRKGYHYMLAFLGYNTAINYSPINFKNYINNMPITKIPQIMEFEPLKKHEGWINIFTLGNYDPLLYHVSLTQTVFLKLEGNMLRFSFTHSKIPKRALWDEKEHKVSFYKHQICDLEGASIKLLPNGIVKKRHWSKKYPICVVIKNRTKIEIQSHPETDTSHDANKDPEKDLQNINFDSIIGLSNDLDIKGGTPKRSNSPPSKHSDDVSGNFSNSPLKSKSRDIPTKAKEHFTKRKKRKISKKEMSTIYDELIDFDSSSIEDDDDTHFLNSDSSSSGDEQKPHISPREKFRLSLENAVSHAIDESENVSLYIFGRTGRQKAELFRRLKIAIDEANAVKSTDMPSFEDTSKNENFDFDSKSSELTEDDKSKKDDPESKVKVAFAKGEKGQPGCSDTPSVLWTPKGSLKESILTDAFNAENDIDFWRYMKNIIEAKHQFPQSEKPNDNFLWLNAMIGRIAFDSFKNPVWIAKLQERIQKKLTSLKLPSFMGPLCVSALELGCDAPLVHGATVPVLDSCGLWLDLQVSYSGHATMTLTTQLNLMSLKERKDSHHDDLTQEHTTSGTPVGKKNALAVYYSDLEDTAESSSDDDNTFNTSPQISKATSNEMIQPHVNVGNTPAKKLLRMVDKIAASKYFQHVTEYKYVKRAMEGVSNTDLKLNVELNALLGCFTINIPPPPTDRLWFGFRGSPQLVVRAKPIFGSRVINFAHVTSWIERRLCKELEKILVYPNMEDIIIDSMMEPVID